MKVQFRALELGLSLLPTIGISLAPETYSEGGGGLLDDVDVTFLALKFRTSEGTPYDKPGSKTVPLLQIDMLPEGTQDVHTQYFSCGPLDKFVPSANGETLDTMENGVRLTTEQAKDKPGINKNTNAAVFLLSLVQAGFPGDRLKGDKISDLAGTKVHVLRKKADRNFRDKKEGEREATVLTVSRLISLPDGAAPVTGQSPVVATAKAAAPAPVKYEPVTANGGVFGDGELAMLVMQVLGANSGTMKKTQLMQEVFKAASGGAIPADAKDEVGKPARVSAPQKAFSDAFLGSQPYWRFDGQTVTLLT